MKTFNTPEHIQVVIETTSTYWMKLAYALFETQFAVSVVNPIEPKYFSKMRRQHSQTDAIDAVILMEFAENFKPQLRTPPLRSAKPRANI